MAYQSCGNDTSYVYAGNLIIGGLEEAGWMYVLQPRLDKKWLFFQHLF